MSFIYKIIDYELKTVSAISHWITKMYINILDQMFNMTLIRLMEICSVSQILHTCVKVAARHRRWTLWSCQQNLKKNWDLGPIGGEGCWNPNLPEQIFGGNWQLAFSQLGAIKKLCIFLLHPASQFVIERNFFLNPTLSPSCHLVIIFSNPPLNLGIFPPTLHHPKSSYNYYK